MNKINIAQIVEVRVLPRRKNPHYEYREAWHSWFFGSREAGFYDVFDSELMTPGEIEKDDGLVCVDKVVYFKPRIYMKMSNGDDHYLYFDTEEAAQEYFNTAPEFEGIKWLNV